MATKRAEPELKSGPARKDEGDTAPVWATRKRNLLWLRQKFEEDMLRKFPDEPARGLDLKFSEHLSLHPRYFSHIKAGRRNIGNDLAREAERVFSLPLGWMDTVHGGPAEASKEEDAIIETVRAAYRNDPEGTRIAVMALMQEFMARKFSGKP